MFLVSSWCHHPDSRAKPGYVCPRQVVHRWCLCLFFSLSPSPRNWDSVSNPLRRHHFLLQHRVVHWFIVGSLGDLRNTELRQQLGLENSVTLASVHSPCHHPGFLVRPRIPSVPHLQRSSWRSSCIPCQVSWWRRWELASRGVRVQGNLWRSWNKEESQVSDHLLAHVQE